MSVLTTSWRGSLLATALCAMLGNAPSPAAADDNPTPPQTTSDREALYAKFQAIRARAAALDEQGKHDDADRLRRDAKEMMSKSGLAPIAPSDPRVLFVTPGNPEQDKIMARLKEIGQKIHILELEGKYDQAEQLKREAKELYGKLNAAGAHTLIVAGPSPERQKLYESYKARYKALQGAIEVAKREGDDDQVHRLMQEIEALRAKLRATEATLASQSASGGEREARLKHLCAAAENLKAAGCDAEATHVLQLIDHIHAESRDSNPGLANAVDFTVTTPRRVHIDARPSGSQRSWPRQTTEWKRSSRATGIRGPDPMLSEPSQRMSRNCAAKLDRCARKCGKCARNSNARRNRTSRTGRSRPRRDCTRNRQGSAHSRKGVAY